MKILIIFLICSFFSFASFTESGFSLNTKAEAKAKAKAKPKPASSERTGAINQCPPKGRTTAAKTSPASPNVKQPAGKAKSVLKR